MRRWMLLIACLVCPALSWAADAKPPELTTIRSGEPLGTARLTYLWFDVYDAALWTDAPRFTYSAPFGLTLTYLRAIAGEDLVDRTFVELDRLHGATLKDMERFRSVLRQSFPDVAVGDRITAIYQPNGGVRFYHNGRATGQIHDPIFARQLMDIWLSPNTSEPAMRRQLLGDA